MRRALLALLVLAACDPAPVPAQAPPAPTPTEPPPTATADPVPPNERAAIAQGQAEMAAAMEDKQRKKAEIERLQADNARRSADWCDKHRPERATEAQTWAKKELALVKSAPAITGRCKLSDVKTGAAAVTKQGNGWRVAPEVRDDVKCAGGPPPGVTLQDAYVVLVRKRAGENDPSIADDIDAPPIDCRASDVAAGLVVDVHVSDAAGIAKLLAWKPGP